MDSEQPPETEKNERLERLSRHAGTVRSYNPARARWLRRLRLLLPVIALMIIAVLFTWPNMQTQIVQDVQEAEETASSGRKELLNPVFESVDQKNQPYKIIAKRAIQGETEDELIILEEPSGTVKLSSGEDLDVTAQSGAYRQDVNRLFLEGDVKLVYDQQYTLKTAELDIDMKEAQAWSETDVRTTGPMGTLQAKGLEARNAEGILNFTGPAKLVLTDSLPGL